MHDHHELGLSSDYEHTTAHHTGDTLTLTITIYDDTPVVDTNTYAAELAHHITADDVTADHTGDALVVTTHHDLPPGTDWPTAWDTYGYPTVATITNLHNRPAAGPYIWDLI